MSDRLALVEDRDDSNNDSPPCRPRSNNAVDTVSYFALGLVFAGLIFAAVGFLYPRGLTRDPNASARENERVDIEYMRLSDALQAIVITGMILISMGGLILAAIFTNTVVCEECRRLDGSTETRAATSGVTSHTPITSSAGITIGQDYGTISADTSQRQ